MVEKIGRVQLDLSAWDGQDEYSDGDIEKELLERLQAGESAADILKTDDRYPVIYHFSPERQNVLSWYPFRKTDEVLEVGAGLGAVTGALCEKCGQVTSLDLSAMRSRINAYRNKDYGNLNIVVSNIQNFSHDKKYDVITLTGVLEYAQLFFKSQNPFQDMLTDLKARLKPNGIIFIAIENQFGLKYFSGAREDHNWKLYSGVEGYLDDSSAKTFGRKTLEQLVREAGFQEVEFFYPFPDYKMPRNIFSEKGKEYYSQVQDDFPNFGEYLYRGADQQLVMKAGIRDGLFETMANSFIVVLSAGEKRPEEVVFSKYSSKRSPQYAIRTDIIVQNGKKAVRKIALNKIAEKHIDTFVRHQQALAEKMQGVDFPKITRVDGGVEIEFIEGRSFAEKLLSVCGEGVEPFVEALKEYERLLDPLAVQSAEKPKRELIFPAPVDFTFDNLIITGERMTALDQEWISAEGLPKQYIVWRAVHFFFERFHGRIPFEENIILSKLGITETDLEEFNDMEGKLRAEIFNSESMFEIIPRYEAYAPAAKTLVDANKVVKVASLYVDYGQGYENGRSFFKAVNVLGEIKLSFCLKDSRPVNGMRFDPIEGFWCKVKIKEVTYHRGKDTIQEDINMLEGNFIEHCGNEYLFESFDARMLLHDFPPDVQKVEIIYSIELFGDEHIEEKIYHYHDVCAERDLFRNRIGELTAEKESLREQLEESKAQLAEYGSRKNLLKKLLKKNTD